MTSRLLLAALVAALPTPGLANGPDCGGDANSSAVVVEHRPPRRGPLVAKPDTLCADVEDVNRPDVTIDLYGGLPLNAGSGASGTDGASGGSAPYSPQGGRWTGPRPAPRPR